MTEFSELGLSPSTLQAVADTGYTTATPIQAQAIPVALAGQDVLGIAQTGTGKTAAFTLPMVDRLASGRSKARMPRALVLAPTRELADQVAESFARYAKGTKLSWALLIGGVSMADQVAKLDRGVDVLIATPGRLIDLFERSKVLLTGVSMMVVDEADRMLDMGFIPDIERIFKMTPPKKQTLFFSATMPPEITRLTQQFLNNPVRIEASRPATTATTITQHLVRIPSSDPKAKRMALRALIGRADVRNGIIFCNRKSEVDVVAKSLKVHGLDAAPIHGDLDQSLRTKTLAAFRSGELKLLVASDVAARGLDIPDVSHVFNYDVPHHADDYVHRIGRTGRAGKLGETFMIITPADSKGLDKVLKLIGQDPKEEVLDLDWSQGVSAPSSRSGGRSSSRSGGDERSSSGRSGGRDRSRGRPESETSTVSMTPLEVVEPRGEVPAAAATEDKPARPPRERRPRRGEKPRAEAMVQSESPQAEAPPERAAPERRPDPARAQQQREPQQPREAQQPRDPQRDTQAGRNPAPGVQRNTREPGDNGVVGFGSDIPAFLRPKK